MTFSAFFWIYFINLQFPDLSYYFSSVFNSSCSCVVLTNLKDCSWFSYFSSIAFTYFEIPFQGKCSVFP